MAVIGAADICLPQTIRPPPNHAPTCPKTPSPQNKQQNTHTRRQGIVVALPRKLRAKLLNFLYAGALWRQKGGGDAGFAGSRGALIWLTHGDIRICAAF